MKTRKVNFIGILVTVAIVISVSVVCTTDSVSKVSGAVRPTAQETTSNEMKTTNGSVDFVKAEETVNLVNGTISEHDVENGKMVLYKNQDKIWSLKRGETICIDVNIKDILKDGQTAVIGYVIDDSYIDIFNGKITQKKSIKFTAPKEGDYTFYFIGASSDTIHIQSLSVL